MEQKSPTNKHDDHNLGESEVDEKASSQLITTTNHSNSAEHIRVIRTVEDLYAALGDPGRYAVLIFAILSLNMLTVGSNHAAGVFLDYSPSYLCYAFGKNDSVGFVNNECSSANMSQTNHQLVNETQRCERGQWSYQVHEGQSSSITEWDLVCDRSGLAHLSTILYYVGVMVGGLVFGYVSDLVGRRWSMLVTLYMSVGLGFGIAFTRSVLVYIVLRALMGVAIQGLLTATYIILLELFGPRYRGFSGNALYCIWAISLNYLGLAAWLLKDWRYIQLACITQACIGIFCLWLIPESLRWLLANSKEKEATALIAKIHRFNRCTDSRCLDPGLVSRLTEKKSVSRPSMLDLLRVSALRRRTVILGYIAFAVNLGYWGLTYNTQALVGNMYQNFMLNAVPEIFFYLTNIFVLNRFGRKRPMIFYFCCTSACCFLSGLLLTFVDDSSGVIVTLVCTIGRLAASGLMGTNDVFMAELYPTVVRNTGVGVCVFLGRIGAAITPVVFSLSDSTFQAIPLFIVGLVTALAALISVLLPDTWKKDLPETLHDLEMSMQVPAYDGQGLLQNSGKMEKDEPVTL